MTPGVQRLSGLDALLAALRRAAAGRRQEPDVAAFCMDAEPRCLALGRALRRPACHPEAWRPQAGRLVQIHDPKPRWITVVPFADRVVHHAIMAEVEPALERYAIADTYACRPGKGQHRAVRRAQTFCRRWPWALKADISAYFASIPRARLIARLKGRGIDPGVRVLIERILGDPEQTGLPVGSLSSQHLANFYLGALDHYIKDELGFPGYLRYMDDFLIFGDRGELRALRHHLEEWLPSTLGLRLNPRSTQLHRTQTGLPYLGWVVRPDRVRARRANLQRWLGGIAATHRALASDQLDEEHAVASVAARIAHLSTFEPAARRRHLLRGILSPVRDPGLNRLQPRHPRRLLEQHRVQPAGSQPQQELARQPLEQRGVPPVQLSVQAPGAAAGWVRLPGPHRDADPALVPGADFCHDGESTGADSRSPGRGLSLRRGVATGHPFRKREPP